jgi:hypothetical protein
MQALAGGERSDLRLTIAFHEKRRSQIHAFVTIFLRRFGFLPSASGLRGLGLGFRPRKMPRCDILMSSQLTNDLRGVTKQRMEGPICFDVHLSDVGSQFPLWGDGLCVPPLIGGALTLRMENFFLTTSAIEEPGTGRNR